MRALLVAALLIAAAPAGLAQPRASHGQRPPAPRPIGRFGDWQVAMHAEAGTPICYAFVRARSSSLIIPGRGDVVLTVTRRPNARPAVAVSAGFPIPGRIDGSLQAGTHKLSVYIAGRSAFARNGQDAVAAFAVADRVLSRFPAPRGGDITDSFSLRGFSAAYARIGQACPPA